jgi:4-alpha-glucanotransferase
MKESSNKNNTTKKMIGVTVPLGALYTAGNESIGEYPDLIPFASFCKENDFNIIQLLPVNDTGTQSSPYSGLSAFALHPIYIRIKDIENFDVIYKKNKKLKSLYDNFIQTYKYANRYDYDGIQIAKYEILKELYSSLDIVQNGKPDEALSKWIKNNPWIKEYCVYKNLKWNYTQSSWKFWHEADQNMTGEDITKQWNTLAFKKDHLFYAWIQMIAANQFENAVNEVHNLGILLKGDMPILMNEDSSDAWAYPQFFNQNLKAGAPSDGDNPKGQNWGFPTYNWKNLKEDDYSWWKNRLSLASRYYDAYRLDHILGFFRIWSIPSQDKNALNGHAEPYCSIKKAQLYEKGFNDDRIRWLSQPHIPTGVIENITWNREKAHEILNLFANKIDNQELWLFDKEIKGSKDIENANFDNLCTCEAEQKIKEILVNYWSDRTLIEVSKNNFVSMWTYSNSTSWKSLNDNEKIILNEIFNEINIKNEKAWKKQADDIFNALTTSVKMIPCGEDLGVNIDCVPSTMLNHQILGLRVLRWCRDWNKQNQPYIDFKNYTKLSVTTTSVHDSSTIRQWWDEEKDSVKEFIKSSHSEFGINNDSSEINSYQIEEKARELAQKPFSDEIAKIIMKISNETSSIWSISPLQDYLYSNKDLWLEKSQDERINIPGTVTKFNWTYRIPIDLENLKIYRLK